jgi:HNH endonuclease/Sigma-70, region 4
MAATPAQRAHIERLNSLPQVRATQFKRGGAGRKTGTWVACHTCGTEVYRTPYRLSITARQFCSKACTDRLSPVRDEVVRLYKQGLKYREIAERMGRAMGTVAGMLHEARIQDRHGQPRSERGRRHQAFRSLPKACELCGYGRFVEVAHIVPRAKGGTYDLTNVYALCANCHHLFDYGMLTAEERAILEEVRRAREK